MKKIFCFALLFLLLPLLVGCAPDAGFFGWTDGYVALPESADYFLPLQYFYLGAPSVWENNVVCLDFDGINDAVQISGFKFNAPISENFGYKMRLITINFKTTEKGVFETQNLIVTFKDGTQKKYPIGNWVFDVGESEREGLIDTYTSTGATTRAGFFPYKYEKLDDNAKIIRLQYAKDGYLEDENGLLPSSGISLADSFEAPAQYVKSKLTVELNGQEYTVYGAGCCCGGIAYDTAFIEESKKHAEALS